MHCKYDKLVPWRSLSPHPKNRNKHPDDQIERLAQLIQYQGVRAPILVSNLSGHIVKGHGTLLAIVRNDNNAQVPIVYQDFESEEQEYAFVQSDNAIASWAELDLSGINADLGDLGPDFDIDLLGIKDFELEPADKNQEDPDACGELPAVPKCKSGDLFILGDHRLLCGDSTVSGDVQRLMNGEKADMVFTSPPYLDLRDYGGGLDLSTETLSKIFDWPTRYFCVNLGIIIRERRMLRYWDEWIASAEGRGLPLLSWNVWDKGNASSIGHQQAMFGVSHEWIFVFGDYRELNRTKENKLGGGGSWSGSSQRQKDGSLVRKAPVEVGKYRQLDTVFQLQSLRNFSEDYTGHPAAFPTEFPLAYIEACSKTGAIIGDPFCGSGTTLIACEKTNRKCFGMEIDPIYCDVILDRWAKYTGLDPVREDGTAWSIIKANGETT